jgi:hypothetical protein
MVDRAGGRWRHRRVGLAGLLGDAAKTMPTVWLKRLVGLLLVHDFLLAPLVHLAGRRLRDWAPEAGAGHSN